jgi:hypothetical protein
MLPRPAKRLTLLDAPGVRSLPIDFQPPLVRALLRQEKTVTRRLLTAKGFEPWAGKKTEDGRPWARHAPKGIPLGLAPVPCRYGEAGTLLYVREPIEECGGLTLYTSTREVVLVEEAPLPWRWQPRKLAARYCPKEAARLLLENTGVRGEWLQELTEEEAQAEGMERHEDGERWRGFDGGTFYTARGAFTSLWNQLHQDDGTRWDDNPGVFRVGLLERQRRWAGEAIAA